MEVKHTPGEWKASLPFEHDDTISVLAWDKPTVRKICDLSSGFYVGKRHAIKNAHLIAAAPDLLAACEALDEFQKFYEKHACSTGMPGNQFYSDKAMAVVEQARAAIAKATSK